MCLWFTLYKPGNILGDIYKIDPSLEPLTSEGIIHEMVYIYIYNYIYIYICNYTHTHTYIYIYNMYVYNIYNYKDLYHSAWAIAMVTFDVPWVICS